jgi:hypothetical protein
MAHTMKNKANIVRFVRLLRPSWRAVGEGGAGALPKGGRVRVQSEHTPLKGVRLFACSPVVASKIEAAETLLRPRRKDCALESAPLIVELSATRVRRQR